MLIRKMTIEDIPQVIEIERTCFSVPWSQKSFEESIYREDTLFLVYEESETSCKQEENSRLIQKTADAGKKEMLVNEIPSKITGYIGMYISFEEANITNVAVHPNYRKVGYGKELVAAAICYANDSKLEKIFLEVRVSNEPALSLYQKMGFDTLGIRKNFYEHPTEDAYIMCCDIKESKMNKKVGK